MGSKDSFRGVDSVNTSINTTDKRDDDLCYERSIDYHLNQIPFQIHDDSSESENDDEPPPKKHLHTFKFMNSDQSFGMRDNVGNQFNECFGRVKAELTVPLKEERQSPEPELKFDPSIENVQINENVKWISSPTTDDLDELSQDVLDFWLKYGQRKATLEDEVKFCSPLILQQILKSKSMFDEIDRAAMIHARSRSNPFEKIKRCIFQNRAAVKIANLDAILDFMFTNPVDEEGKSLVKDLLYFADICAGPGGFSEYVLWRKKWQAKGIGFTLRNADDFQLNAFSAGDTETFETYYGIHGDGNILDPANIISLANYVLNQTHGTGVHFLMADGGFSVEEKNIQEITCKQLYLCQCLAALTLVQEGGNFVIKLFDVFTLFSTGLIYLMYKCFKQLCIVKPNTSRASSSERYLVGKHKKANTNTIRSHLFNVNQQMWFNKNANEDVLELVSYEIIKEDKHFFDYLCESNNSIGRNQVVSLLKIAEFCANKKLVEPRQGEIHQKCLEAWMLPAKQTKIIQSIYGTFQQLMANWYNERDFMMAPDQELTGETDLSQVFRDRSDWYFVPIDTVEGTGNYMRTFFMSQGGYNVYCYTSNGTWKRLQNIALEISADTLVYGEIVTELHDEKNSPTFDTSLHIIDGIILGGINIRNLPLKDRLKMCERFANSLNKSSRIIMCGGREIPTSQIFCKPIYTLNDFRRFFDQLSYCTLKDGRKRLGMKILNNMGPDRWYVPRGLLFLNEMKPNIEKAFSKTYQKPYFMDKITGNSFFQDQIKDPESIYSSFKTSFVHRIIWEWKVESQVYEKLNEKGKIDGILNRCDLDEYIFK